MKKSIRYILCAAILCTLASAQVRFDIGIPGSAGAVTTSGSGGLSYLIGLGGATLQFCSHPANAVPCTNTVQTYSSISLLVQCASNAQVTLQGSSTCQAGADPFGNMGVWIAAGGTYDYTITSSGISYGPFTVTLGGSGGGGGGSGCQVNPADGGCAIAGNPTIDLFSGPSGIGGGTNWDFQVTYNSGTPQLNIKRPVNISGSTAGTLNIGFGADPGIGSGVTITTGTSGTPYTIYLPSAAGTGFLTGSNTANKVSVNFKSNIDLAADVGSTILPLANGGTGSSSQSGAAQNVLCTPARAGDITFWNGTVWNCFGGNNSGTGIFSENGTGVPGWISEPIGVPVGGTGLATQTSNAIYKGNGTGAEVASSITDDGTTVVTTELLSSGNKVVVGTSDFTSANSASLQAITGLSFSLGTIARNYTFHCALMYSQATNVSGDQFGIGVLTTAPTNVNASGIVNTSASANTSGVLNGLSTTTPTAIVTFQPGSSSIFRAELDGTVELAGGGAQTLNFYVLNGTAADVIVIKRGSYCAIQ